MGLTTGFLLTTICRIQHEAIKTCIHICLTPMTTRVIYFYSICANHNLYIGASRGAGAQSVPANRLVVVRFPLPTLLCAGYSVKLKKKSLYIKMNVYLSVGPLYNRKL